MDAGRSSRTICARAPGFRPVLLSVVLFWCCAFYVSAAECTGWVNPDDSVVWPAAGGWSPAQFCANAVSAVPDATTCSPVGPAFSLCVGSTCYPFVRYPVGCGADDEEPEASLIPLPDAIELAWAVGGVWILVGSILTLRRAAS